MTTALPSATWRMLSRPQRPARRPTGLDAAWAAAAGVVVGWAPRTAAFVRRAGAVVALEREHAELSERDLEQRIAGLRELFRRGREGPGDVVRAFAAVREAAYRELGQRPFATQVAGAMAIEAGCIAEMATGEGKTLAATMPTAIAGWRGGGCHVVTVNDYLARRDAEWMAPVYRRCGVRVAHVENASDFGARREAYRADVTYCTNKEAAADFLRDQIVLMRLGGAGAAMLDAAGARGASERLAQRGLERAIVDEADSVLIDEGVTPLIISAETAGAGVAEAHRDAAAVAARLQAGRDFTVDHRHREVELTGAGRERVAELAVGLGPLWRGARRREELVSLALSARELYARGRQYVLQEGRVVIVDEFTGRLTPDRSWRDGLHQSVEAKEGLAISGAKETQARISFQRFFRQYRRLSGMTGTALEAGPELWRIYRLRVAAIPMNRELRRVRHPDVVLPTEAEKWLAVADDVEREHASGRPVLVGTRSVRASELLSGLLGERALGHQLLNAVRHGEEAAIIERAGERGRITISTNMAGRGADIRLGEGVAELGGLHVVATERHEARRIDRQLFGRAGRQGDPGSARVFASLEDEVVWRFAPGAGGAAARWPAIAGVVVRLAQRRAERHAARQRAAVLRADDWLDDSLGFSARGL